MAEIELRDVVEADLSIFFENQLDPEANYMAAFTAKDPADRDAFIAHWRRILNDDGITNKTILFQGEVVGSIASFEQEGELEVTYWLGKAYWGKGLATRALGKLLELVERRPLHARVAKDNIGSLRVLQKCGFIIVGEDKGFANARGTEVEEYLLQLSEG